MTPIVPLAGLGLLAWWIVSQAEGPAETVGPTAGHELESYAIGAYQAPWASPNAPSMLSIAIMAYEERGIDPRGLRSFLEQWNAAGDQARGDYATASQSVNAQACINLAANFSAAGLQELAAGMLLLARYYSEGPTPNLAATADWMARGADPARVPT